MKKWTYKSLCENEGQTIIKKELKNHAQIYKEA